MALKHALNVPNVGKPGAIVELAVAAEAAGWDGSVGRVIAGFGLGAPPKEEFADFGEPTDLRARVGQTGEALGRRLRAHRGRPRPRPL